MSAATDSIRAALEAVVDPTFDKDLGTLGSLLAVQEGQEGIRIQVRLSSPSEALRQELQSRLHRAAESAGVSKLNIEWDLQVPVREIQADDPLPGVANVILVMSGKGGVGKSTVATNLALALKQAGSRVGLLDADMYGPSLPTMLGIQGHPVSRDGKKIAPLERFGLKLMSIGFLLEDPHQAIVWRGPMLHGALQQFLSDVDWGELDYLVLDLPPGTGDVALTIAQKLRISGVVMVTTPQEVALQDVYKGISMCRKLNLPILGIVENMSFFVDSAGVTHYLFGQGGGAKVATFAEAPLLGQVPIDPQAREWGDAGTPVVQAQPSSPASVALSAIAERLSEKVAQSHFARGGGLKAPASKAPTRLKILR